MRIGAKLDDLHFRARKNRYLGYFAIFCRLALAAGFIPSGMQKVFGERFTVLAVNHPMGNFLEAFFHTGFYYPLVGFMQVLAAVLLLIPRTVTIGAFIYLPIILNICILSLAVRFDGSLVTSPLMLCAVLYLLCWDYHKWKFIFPFNDHASKSLLPPKSERESKFPYAFFIGVLMVVGIVLGHTQLYEIMPRNTIAECKKQCTGEEESACIDFCDCIHESGHSLSNCLEAYERE